MNARTSINPAALTPTQKLQLTRNRIWGHMVGGGYRSGYKELKQNWAGAPASRYYEFARLKMIYPFISDWDALNRKKVKYEERKQRIFMRGVKIGKKQGGDSKSGMNIFEMAKKKEDQAEREAEKAQKERERKAKYEMTDKSLGI